MPTSLFIVEDHALMRELLKEMVARRTDFTICGTAATAEEALAAIPDAAPDLVLTDVSLPSMSGIDLVRQLRPKHPHIKYLMLSGHAEQLYVRDAFDAGANGYVMKGDPHQILAAIQQVLEGETYVSKEVNNLWRP